MFEEQTREFRCDRLGCETKAGAHDGKLPSGWKRHSEDVRSKEGIIHRWWDLCPGCAQLLSVTTS